MTHKLQYHSSQNSLYALVCVPLTLVVAALHIHTLSLIRVLHPDYPSLVSVGLYMPMEAVWRLHADGVFHYAICTGFFVAMWWRLKNMRHRAVILAMHTLALLAVISIYSFEWYRLA